MYGLQQIPRAFWEYLNQKLINCGLEQSNFDLLPFIGKKISVLSMYITSYFVKGVKLILMS